MRYSLRELLPADFETLFAIHEAAMRHYVEATWGRWDEEFQRDHFRGMLERGMAKVVQVRGEAVGLLELRDAADQVEVLNIELAPVVQRCGLGTEILGDVIGRAGRRPVALQVLKVNPARRLYERLGFVAAGETATHILMRRPSATS